MTLYGDTISFEYTERDDYVFKNWLQSPYTVSLGPTPQIIELFAKAAFMPLPVALDYASHQAYGGYGVNARIVAKRSYETNAVEGIICKAPGLAPLMRANGESCSASVALGLAYMRSFSDTFSCLYMQDTARRSRARCG